MALAAKQEQFAQCMALKGMDAIQAFTESYSTAKMNPAMVQEKSSALALRADVAARIAVLKARANEAIIRKGAKTLDEEIVACDEAIENARSRGQVSAEVAAIKLRAQLGGHLVERKEIKTGQLEDSDIAEMLALRDELRERARLAREADDLVAAEPERMRANGAVPLRRVIG